MAQKSTKIDDVKRPGKTLPSASGRPILVSNQPTMPNDPMMAPASGEPSEGPDTGVMTHSTKAIQPIDPALSKPAEEQPAEVKADAPAPEAKASPEPKPEETPKAAEPAADAPIEEAKSAPAADPDAPAAKPLPASGHEDEGAMSEAELAAAEAKAKREAEIEEMIASGKYAVPINSVRRKRSHVYAAMLCVVALVLALVLVDALADMGTLKLPSSIPHTHFFSGK